MHLLNTAHYVKKYNPILAEAIKNTFRKMEIIMLERDINKEADIIAEFLHIFKNLNILSNKDKLEKYTQ